MTRPTHIFGHLNPDADSICSAIAYADFKRQTAEGDFRAARCGNSNARIDAILDHFGVELPPFISDVTPRLREQMATDPVTIGPGDPCQEALERIERHDIQLLPVVAADGIVRGSVSIFDLGQYFIPKRDADRDIRRVHTSLRSIVAALDARILNLERPEAVEDLWVRVAAMGIDTYRRVQEHGPIPPEKSVIVVGDRTDIQEVSIDLGVRLLVVSGGLEVEPRIVKRATERGVGIVSSQTDTATTAWTIRAATRVESVMQPPPTSFRGYETVASVQERTARLGPAVFMVTDERGVLEGVFTRRDILKPSETRIILVDHNELAQAVPGADQVQIVEVVDHHRLGDLRTREPILFINRPVGSTCTIIADQYRAAGLTPSREIAGMLMAGLVSDTLNLRSPTTTPVDTQVLDWLEPLAGIDGSGLAEIIFSSGSVVRNHRPDELLGLDRKEYHEGSRRFAISQVEELGFDPFWEQAEALAGALQRAVERNGLDFAALLVTDVNSQDSLLMIKGNRTVIEAVSYPEVIEGEVFRLDGVVSRKKQLLPWLSGVLARLDSGE